MRTVHVLLLSLACALTTTTAACTEVPEDDATAVELAAADDGLFEVAVLDQLSPGVIFSDGGTLVGRFVKLLLGETTPDIRDRRTCTDLNFSQETFTVAGCTVTIENRNCDVKYSASFGQFICECDSYIVGARGAGC